MISVRIICLSQVTIDTEILGVVSQVGSICLLDIIWVVDSIFIVLDAFIHYTSPKFSNTEFEDIYGTTRM